MPKWLSALLRRKRRTYVITYDLGEDAESHEAGDVSEEYYGFFTSREEARYMGGMLIGDNPKGAYANVRLCVVLENLTDDH